MQRTKAAPRLERRGWVPPASEDLVTELSTRTAGLSPDELDRWVHDLVESNHQIHDVDCVNLNPATNTMNPRAEALLASGVGTRPSLGYPGAKYEMGLEAIEQIEVIAAELVARVFDAPFAEVRVPSGAIANLYAFMATAQAGDAIIVPPASVAGHVTHHDPGVAGLYGLEIHEAPIDPERYTIDTEALAAMAERVQPKLITVGSSLNLSHHPVAEIRAIADEVGAKVLFDAAHLSGVIAGGAWPNPLHQGAHMMTMSTYKSLAGPPAGLLVANDAELAERIDAIAYPGLTANFDAAKTAALAITMIDWLACGEQYATAMVDNAQRLGAALAQRDVPVFATATGHTQSHALAVDVRSLGGGHPVAERLRRANVLASAIGLPDDLDAGLRVGTNEITRWGAAEDDMDELAALIERGLGSAPETVAGDVSAFRQRFDRVHFLHEPG